MKEKFVYKGTTFRSKEEAAEAAADDLVKAKDFVDRRFAAGALNQLGDFSAPHVEGLAAALQDSDRGVRYWVAITLAGLGQVAADHHAEFVKLLTEEEDPGIRYWAIVALGAFGAAAVEHTKLLSDALTDADPHVRVASAKALVTVNPDSLPGAAKVLKESLDDYHAIFRASAAEALGELGPAAYPHASALAVALGDQKAAVRKAAAEAFHKLGLEAVKPAALALAKAATSDADSAVRSVAFEALSHVDPATVLEDEDVGLRAWAIEALVSHAEAKIADLHQYSLTFATLIKDVDAGVRYWAAIGLGMVGLPAAEHAEPVIAALEDSDVRVRFAATRALKSIKPDAIPSAAGTIASSLSDKDPRFRQCAAECLGLLGEGAKEQAAALHNDLGDEDEAVRLAVVRTLQSSGRQPVRSADTILAKMAKSDSDGHVRRAALTALEQYFLAKKFGLG